MIEKKRFIISTLAVFLLGSSFHFMYELLGRSVLAAPFFAVNESVWEHMKLLSTAVLAWMAVEWFIAEKCLRPCFYAVRSIALPLALLAIPVIFYFVEGALGVESLVIDIINFFISTILYQVIVMRIEGRCAVYSRYNRLGVAVLCAIILLFAVFTFITPHLPIFLDTQTGTYGIMR